MLVLYTSMSQRKHEQYSMCILSSHFFHEGSGECYQLLWQLSGQPIHGEKRSILSLSGGHFSPWWVGPMAPGPVVRHRTRGVCGESPHGWKGQKRKRKRWGSLSLLQRHTLITIRPKLPEFLTAPQSTNQETKPLPHGPFFEGTSNTNYSRKIHCKAGVAKNHTSPICMRQCLT